MIQQLELKHSLFYCEDQQLEDFILLYKKWHMSLPPIEVTPLSELDTIAAIFNQWLAVNCYNIRPIMKTSKYFSHSFSYYVLSLIDFDIESQHFLEQSKSKPDLLFLFAYYSSQKTLQLIHQLLTEKKRTDILASLKTLNYFILKDPADQPNDFLEHIFFKHTKDIAQYFAHDYKHSFRYKYCLIHALKAAKQNTSIAI